MYHKPRKYLTIAGSLLAVIMIVSVAKTVFPGKKASSDEKEETVQTVKSVVKEPVLLSGYKGIITGVLAAQASSSPFHVIGTSVEDVLVGQRTKERETLSIETVSNQVKESMEEIDDQSWALVEQTKMTDKDYETLLAIVEAEAGGEDLKGRTLVANVILNRVASDLFPNNVTDVVWQKTGGVPQFTPTVDGRIGTLEITDVTREAVNQAIDGTDYSKGALFFLEKEYSEAKNVTWFDENLNFLFRHGVHSFYKY